MSDDFTYRVMRRIIVRMAWQAGIEHISGVALDVLTDAVICHVSAVAERAARITAYCGRQDTNCVDVFRVLEDLDETPRSLAEFFKRQRMAYDDLIDPYPTPRLMDLYRQQEKQRKNMVVFHPYPTIDLGVGDWDHGDPSIPKFFPPFPPPITMDHAAVPDDDLNEDEVLVKSRQDDQDKVKEEMGKLLQGRINTLQRVELSRRLDAAPPEMPIVAMAPRSAGSVPEMTGVRPLVDPEFLKAPGKDNNPELKALGEKKENVLMMQILETPCPTLEQTTKKKKGNEN